LHVLEAESERQFEAGDLIVSGHIVENIVMKAKVEVTC